MALLPAAKMYVPDCQFPTRLSLQSIPSTSPNVFARFAARVTSRAERFRVSSCDIGPLSRSSPSVSPRPRGPAITHLVSFRLRTWHVPAPSCFPRPVFIRARVVEPRTNLGAQHVSCSGRQDHARSITFSSSRMFPGHWYSSAHPSFRIGDRINHFVHSSRRLSDKTTDQLRYVFRGSRSGGMEWGNIKPVVRSLRNCFSTIVLSSRDGGSDYPYIAPPSV